MAGRQGGEETAAQGEGQVHNGQDEGHRRKEAKLTGASNPVLGIETATPHGGVALASGRDVLAELQVRNPRSHSERLLPQLESLLAANGLKASDLAAVAVSRGPGSFTGLRIGLATAKGLAFSLGLPLYGVPTLEALAANGLPGDMPLCPILDARRGEVFSALYRCVGGKTVRERRERVTSPRELLSSLPEGSLIIGEPPPGFLAALEECPQSFPLVPPHLAYPRAAVVALEGARLLAGGATPEGEDFVPLYVRPSDAESNREKKRGKTKEV